MEEHVAQESLTTMIDVPENAPSWLALIFMTIIGFFIKRDLRRADVERGQLFLRVNALEIDRVKRGDVEFINQRLDLMNRDLNERHRELLIMMVTPVSQRRLPDRDT